MPAGEVGALSAPFFMPPLAAKTFTTALRALEMHSPFGGWRHHLSPLFEVAQQPVLTVEMLMKRIFCGVLFCPPLAGEVRRSRIGGGERSESICRMLIMLYDIESQSRNADFISIARRAIHHPQRRRCCRPLERSDATLLHNLRRQPRPFFKTCGAAATTTLGPKGRQT